MRELKNNKGILCILIISGIFLTVNIISVIKCGFPCGTADLLIRWQEIMCVLERHNPIGMDYLPSIGDISPIAGYMPWAYLLGYVMVGSFNTLSSTAVYASVIFIIIASITALVLYKKIRCAAEKDVCFLIILSFFAQWAVASSWRSGNFGFQCSCMALLAICMRDKKILSGVLLAIAMVKPQIGGLVFITFALLQEYFIIAVTVGVCLVSWLAASLLTAEMPWTLLTQMYHVGMDFEYPSKNNGIFTILRNFNVPNMLIMLLGMSLGIALCIWAVQKIRNSNAEASDFLLFSPAALLSPIWFYYNPYDKAMMILPMVVLIFGICDSKKHAKYEMITLICAFANCVGGHLIWKRTFAVALEHIGLNVYLAQDIAGVIEGSVYIAILLIIINGTKQTKKKIGLTSARGRNIEC